MFCCKHVNEHFVYLNQEKGLQRVKKLIKIVKNQMVSKLFKNRKIWSKNSL